MDKILQNLGLCKKANKLVAGFDIVQEKMSKGLVKMIFIANDASANTISHLESKSCYHNVIVNKNYSSIELNNAIGLNNIKVIGITDIGFVKLLNSCNK